MKYCNHKNNKECLECIATGFANAFKKKPVKDWKPKFKLPKFWIKFWNRIGDTIM